MKLERLYPASSYSGIKAEPMVIQQRNTGFNFNKPHYSLDTLTLSTPQFRSGNTDVKKTENAVVGFVRKRPLLSIIIGIITPAITTTIGVIGGMDLQRTSSSKEIDKAAATLLAKNRSTLEAISRAIVSCRHFSEQVPRSLKTPLTPSLTDNSHQILSVQLAGENFPRDIGAVITAKGSSNECKELAQQINESVDEAILNGDTPHRIFLYGTKDLNTTDRIVIEPKSTAGKVFSLLSTIKPTKSFQKALPPQTIPPQGFSPDGKVLAVDIGIKPPAPPIKPNEKNK